MKTLTFNLTKLKKNTLSVFAIFLLVSTFLTSCNKGEIPEETDSISAKTDYEFSKDFELSSLHGDTATIRVYANDLELLNLYSEDNFTLSETNYDEILSNNKDETEENNDVGTLDDEKSPLAFELMNVKKNDSSTALSVTFNHPKSKGNLAKSGWNYYTHYSSSTGIHYSARIIRGNTLKRVYFGLKYRTSGYSNTWYTKVSEWKSLSRNETYHQAQPGVWQFKMRVKTKSRSAYSVAFFIPL
ncbi:hypothetical protein [uncultured Kordia sp.]|uniref:hypothetical protein n=1 Tax=uncultured Kordia sp. TaxID=507699 RepID=UPI002631B00C|nr:hypothetical protein [uncultured Kordia sp.]